MGLRLLLDTNVWLDYFIDRSALHDVASAVIVQSAAREVELLAALPSVKDCFFLIGQELKRMERAQNGRISDNAARAINEVAWACIANMRKLAFIVPVDEGDMIEALILRERHNDFEDNLVVAAAMRARADHVVTSDKTLLAHQPVSCITPQQALELVIK